MTDINTSRNLWRTLASIAATALLSAAGGGYAVGRNSVTKTDLEEYQRKMTLYVDDSVKGVRENLAEQKTTLANIQGQIGNVRESQGRIDGKLDVLIPQLQNLEKK